MRRIHSLVPWMICALLLSVAAARASVIYVNAGATGSPRDGSSWDRGYALVQDAINAASSNDEIWVAAGTYIQTLTLKDKVALYGGFAGTETLRDDRKIHANPTILDANKGGSVITGNAGLSSATIVDGFAITNGKADQGGGVALHQCSVIIRNNTIADNTAISNGWNGGGVLLDRCTAQVLSNTIIRNSSAVHGGGVSCNNDASRVANNTIAFNRASNGSGGVGGGIAVDNQSSTTVAGNTIADNYSDASGDIYIQYYSSPTIASNIVAYNSYGMYVESNCTPRVRYNCFYLNNLGDYRNFADQTGLNGNISTDPLIVPTGQGDFALMPTSPCRDHGDSSSVRTGDTDVTGQPRIQGSSVDIGAWESDGSVPHSPIIHVSAAGDDVNDGLTWDHAKRNIQTAINTVAPSGGEVWVSAETYTELLTIPFGVQVYGGFAGSETERSQRDFRANPTIVDGNLGGSVVIFATLTSRSSILDGFTLTNGQAPKGGGVRLYYSSGVVRNCIITRNTATDSDWSGGGIYLEGSSPLIANNIITFNTSATGAGILARSDSARIVGNVISHNTASYRGGGIRTAYSSAVIANNTITNNAASNGYGGGIWIVQNSAPSIVNNIIAYNDTGVYLQDGTPRVRYNCSWDNANWDYGNMTDPTGKDGNVMFDPAIVTDSRGVAHIAAASSCRNAGDDSVVKSADTDIDGQSRIQGAHVDIGADESDGTAPAYVIVRVKPDGLDTQDGSTWAKAKRRVQAAIDAVAPTGGEVWVAQGIYYGTTISYSGVRVYGGFTGGETSRNQRNVRANPTILDANKGGSVISITDGSSSDTVVDGFTITNGQAPMGGGSKCVGSSPVFRNNTIISNTATSGDSSGGGGGLYLEGNYPAVINCTIRNNTAPNGGGIMCRGGYARIVGNTISSNNASRFGGAIQCYGAWSIITNNTITGNYGGSGSGAIEWEGNAYAEAVNNIIAFNSSGLRSDNSSTRLRYNDVYANTGYDYSNITDPTGQDGNVDWNPLLIVDAHGDPHLAPNSPCINAGDNSVVLSGDTDIDGQTRIQNAFVDLGADESDGSVPTPQIIRVKTTGNDANDGSSWTLAKKRVQAAIDAAALSGGEVWVAKGTYTGTITLPFAVGVYGGFAGTETLRSQRDYRKNVTILDANKGGSAIKVQDAEGPDTILDGFTIKNGTGTLWNSQQVGGGIYIAYSSPTIRNNTITGNTASTADHGGAGIFVVGGYPNIYANTIRQNGPCRFGGGIELWGSNARIASNTIASNTANTNGGGIYGRDGGSPDISNNSIVNNYAGGEGGGTAWYNNITASLTNNIIAFNNSGIRADSCDPRFRYNDVYGNVNYDWSNLTDPTGNDGNIEADPQVSTDTHGDIHIAPTSKCRDAGDNSVVLGTDTDIDGQARIQNGQVDMGADETDGTLPPVPIVRVKPDGNDLNDGSTWALAKRRVQPAVDSVATTGGEVWVMKGTYIGAITMPAGVRLFGGFVGTETSRDQRNWSANETILDANKAGSVVSFLGGQGRDCQVDGFTVTNGSGTQRNGQPVGGGFYCIGAQPTIMHNAIRGNITSGADHGGAGLYAEGGAPLIANNVFRENVASVEGGAIMLWGSNAVIQNNLMTANIAGPHGSAMWIRYGGSPLIANNTIVSNTGGTDCAAVGVWNDSAPTFVNNIIAFNTYGVRQYAADPRFRFNDVFGNGNWNWYNYTDPTGKDGNISADPFLADRTGGNFHLTGASPCLNAGDDSVVSTGDKDLDNQARISDAHVDLGAYEYSGGFTIADAATALRVAAGLDKAGASFTRLNAITSGSSATVVDMVDAVAIIRATFGR